MGILASVLIGLDGYSVMQKSNYGETKHEDARWRCWTSVQSATILAVMGAFFIAVPSPDYKKEIVYKTKIVEKAVAVVTVRTKYKPQIITPAYDFGRLHDKCLRNFSTPHNDSEVRICNEHAYLALGKKILVKRIKVADSPNKFAKIYSDCITAFNISKNQFKYISTHCRLVAREAMLAK
jgi:hypothetical protein